jgi:hypothetical protein
MKPAVVALVVGVLLTFDLAPGSFAAYNVEPLRAGWADWLRGSAGISQTVTCNFDSIAYCELFVGDFRPGAAVQCEAYEVAGSTKPIARSRGATPLLPHAWLRIPLFTEQGGSFMKGRQYEFRFTAGARDSVQVYHQSGDPYPYGSLRLERLDVSGSDLCLRVQGTSDTICDGLWGANVSLRRLTEAALDRALSVARDSIGLGWMRDDFAGWNSVGAFKADRTFGAVDTGASAYRNHHLAVLAILCYSHSDPRITTCPPWDTIHQKDKSPPRNLYANAVSDSNHWARYVQDVMDRLGDVSQFMVWNEPNTRDEYFGNPDTAPRGYGTALNPVDTPRERCSLYVRMCWLAKQVALARGRKIVAGGVSMVRVADPRIGKSPGVQWLDDMLEISRNQYGDARNCFDILSVQPYGMDSRREFDHDFYQEDLDTVRAVMRHHGVADMELWITEMGWGLYAWNQGLSEYVPLPDASAAKSARDLAKLFISVAGSQTRTTGGYDRVFWYELTDFRRAGSRDRPGGFGLLDRTARQARKSSSFAAQQTLRALRGKRPEDRRVGDDLVRGDSRTRNHAFGDPANGRRTWVAWREGESAEVAFPCRTDSAAVALLAYGPGDTAATIAASLDGWLRLPVGTRPVFVTEPARSTISRPDIVVDSVSVTTLEPSAGGRLGVAVHLRNVGTRPTPAGSPVVIALSLDGTEVGRATLRTPVVTTARITVPVRRLPETLAGERLLCASVNPDHRFVELDFDNNSAYRLITVLPRSR